MKNFFSLLAIAAIFIASSAQAAILNVVDAGNDVYSVYLEGGADNGNFDSVEFAATPDAGSSFVNLDAGFNGFFPRLAGEDFTFINALLGAQVAQGGQGWSVLGATNTADLVAFGGGPLGTTISTDAAPGLFLANIKLGPSGKGMATATLFRAGNAVGDLLSAPIGGIVPEPATFVLAGMGILGLAAVRRRMA